LKLTSLFILIFILVGCGYKPSSYYAKQELNSKVYIDTTIDIKNSEGSILTKDIINNIVLGKFNSIIVDEKSKADFLLLVYLQNVDTKSLQTDDQGYVLVKRVTVSINVEYRKNITHSQKTIITTTSYSDYLVSDDSIITEKNKVYAITNAVSKSLSNIFSKIAIENFRK